MMKRFVLVIVCVVLFIGVVVGALTLLVRYTTVSTVTTDTSCAPPCWHTIQPGRTTTWEAVSVLEEMPDASAITQWEEQYGDKIAWRFSYPIKDSAGYIYSVDSRVAAISILTYGSLTVAEALERFGEPDHFWVRHAQTRWRHWLEITLVYPATGVFVRVDVELADAGVGTSAEMKSTSPVGRVVYFDPARYEYLLSSHILFREDEQTIAERSEQWRGLGQVSYGHLLQDRPE